MADLHLPRGECARLAQEHYAALERAAVAQRKLDCALTAIATFFTTLAFLFTYM